MRDGRRQTAEMRFSLRHFAAPLRPFDQPVDRARLRVGKPPANILPTRLLRGKKAAQLLYKPLIYKLNLIGAALVRKYAGRPHKRLK